MNGYYNIIDGLKTELQADEFVNTVTIGDIFDIDLSKQSLYPIAHIMVNNATPGEHVVNFNVSIIVADIVDLSKEEVTDVFLKNDNEQDVLHTTLAVLTKLHQSLLRGDIFDTGIELESVETFEPFTERFENLLAGWVGTFNIQISNNVTKC